MPNIERTEYDDDKGTHVLPPNQREYLTWYATPAASRTPKTNAEWAEQHGLARDTVRKWRQKPVFRREMEKLLAAINVSPSRLQKIVETLYQKAIDKDDRDQVKSAQLYMQYVDKLQPTRVIVESATRDAEALSDEELAAELEATVLQLRAVPNDN